MNLGRYKIIEELGKGSFGTVYKAEDQTLDRVVAIKVLHSQLTVDPGFIGRFKQEAKLSARLDHPNLVPIYDLGQIDGRFFIAMGLMIGGSLRDRLNNEGPFDSEKACDVFSQILQGVQVIHENNIIHRDLKPGNILFDQYGITRISDLGFAKAIHSDASLSLSMSGGMIGTPAYMAPEIWEGKPASPASDIYSLGCILYEILTGEVLFDGESAAEVMTKHVIHGPKLETRVLPPFWKNILEQCLAPKPQDRYASIQQILVALKEENVRPDEPVLFDDPLPEETACSGKEEIDDALQEDQAIEKADARIDLSSSDQSAVMKENIHLASSETEQNRTKDHKLAEVPEAKEQEDLSAFVDFARMPEAIVKPDDRDKLDFEIPEEESEEDLSAFVDFARMPEAIVKPDDRDKLDFEIPEEESEDDLSAFVDFSRIPEGERYPNGDDNPSRAALVLLALLILIILIIIISNNYYYYW